MKVSLIIIGDELLNGRIQDLNGAWLAKYLFINNYTLESVVIIRDSKEEIHKALEESLKRSDIVITSGGIGPTKDDMTKESLASFFNKKIVYNEESINIIKKNYEYYKREWVPESNSYHMIPEDFFVTNNPCGLAPGLGYFDEKLKKIVFSAPGVPQEFKAMVQEEFIPIIIDKLSENKSQTQQITIRTFGVPEEKIFYEHCPNLWDDLSKYGKVSSLPQQIGIDILITFQGNDQLREKYFKDIKNIFSNTPIKENIWQYGELNLAEYLLSLCKEKGLTLAFAESCTGGLAASYMTDIPGSSDVFLGSVVSYANELKMNFLGVKEETIKNFGAVSTQCAFEMAEGVQKQTGADYVLSFSGIAGPGGGSEEKPVGTVAIGHGKKGTIKSEIFNFKGDRKKLKRRFSEIGFLKLIQEIRN